MIAILLSIIFPGLGQIYYRKTGRGLLMIALTFIPFLYPVILIWSIYDCIQLRKKVKVDPINRRETITAYEIGFIIIPLLNIAFLTGASFAISYISDKHIKVNKTEKEMSEISVRLEKYRQENDSYPQNLKEIIGNSPIRQTFLNDYWGSLYRYDRTSDDSFELTSAGQDKMFNTEDDLKIKY